VVFPVHLRTSKNIREFRLTDKFPANAVTTEPIGHIDFLALSKNAEIIIKKLS
jgi:UDP-N-acetylglucosamine 2-epimerase